MKIGFAQELPLPEGKVKYEDARMVALADKVRPKKISPYYVELFKGNFHRAEAIVMREGALLDLLIMDMEKCEARIERSEDGGEVELMRKVMGILENEVPLSESQFSPEEEETLSSLGFLSMKPVLQVRGTEDIQDIIQRVLSKAGIIFFYTAGPKEVHAWNVKKESEIIHCAGRIHSDLERGFIKGDVVGYDEFMMHHNFNECRSRGLVKVVDREHIVEDGDIIEIRFNV